MNTNPGARSAVTTVFKLAMWESFGDEISADFTLCIRSMDLLGSQDNVGLLSVTSK